MKQVLFVIPTDEPSDTETHVLYNSDLEVVCGLYDDSEHQIKGCIEISGLNPADCKLHWAGDLDEARKWLRTERQHEADEAENARRAAGID